MARFDGGWIKLHRKLFEGDIVKNHYCFLIFSWFLVRANYKESKIIWNGQQRTIMPGQCVYGIREIADFWGIGVQTVHRWIRFMVLTERIRNEVGTLGSLVTICNWELYQGIDLEEEQKGNTRGTPEEHERNLNEEVKKVRKDSEKKISRTKVQVEGVGEFIAKYCDAYKRRYGDYPKQIKTGKEKGHAKSLVKDFGLEEAVRLVEAYLKNSSKLFVDRKHDLYTLTVNLNAVSLYTKPQLASLPTPAEVDHAREEIRTGPMPENIKALLDQMKRKL